MKHRLRKIATNNTSILSAMILRDALESLLNEKILVTKLIRPLDDIILRYGNSQDLSCRSDTSLNSPDIISTFSNKKVFADILLDHEISAPKFSREIPSEFPVIIRKTLYGYKGIGIEIANSVEEFNNIWRGNYWWTNIFSKSQEFRVHVVGGKILKIFEKIPNNTNDIVWNSLNSHYSLRSTDNKFKKLKELVDKVVEIFGEYCFFGLDVGFNKGDYFIFEANSAPGINKNTAEAWAGEIQCLLDKTE